MTERSVWWRRALGESAIPAVLCAALLTVVELTRWAVNPAATLTLDGPGLLFSWYGVIALSALIYLVPSWALFCAIDRKLKRRRLGVALCTLALGVSSVSTWAGAGGLRAQPHYGWIAAGAYILVPMVVTLVVDTIFFGRWPPKKYKRGAVVLGLVVCIVFHLYDPFRYPAFHGHLLVLDVALLGYLLSPHLHRPALRRFGIGATVLALASMAFIISDGERVQAELIRYTRIPRAVLSTPPPTRALLRTPEVLIDPGSQVPEERATAARLRYAAAPPAHSARGENVILLVVESVRADTWADPAVTPHFHRYRTSGTYFPRAVAQYPGTPLAYGALLGGHVPSVTVGTGYWSRARLFDSVRDRFAHLFVSLPTEQWFDLGTIRDFLLDPNEPIDRHASTAEALSRLRSQIEERGEGGAFFAWLHLYEPHFRYTTQDGFDFGTSRAERYRSEVAYVDHHLGAFMEWFSDRPEAANTLVVLTGDHGEALGERFNGEAQWTHSFAVTNNLSHIPFFVMGPGIPEGREIIENPAAQIDVMPTIFDFLGEPLPSGYWAGGVPVTDLLEGDVERPLVTEQFPMDGKTLFVTVASAGDARPEQLDALIQTLHGDPTLQSKIAMQLGRYKIIYDRALRRSWVFDIHDDPLEQRDLSRARPELARRLWRRLRQWGEEQAWVTQRLREWRR